MKILLGLVAGAILIVGGAYWLYTSHAAVQQPQGASDYKNATYTIAGNAVTLSNGEAEQTVAPDSTTSTSSGQAGSPQAGSASKLTTKYFGNDFTTDLNGDGVPDVVFLLTQSAGGSGTFFYAVAALNTPHGWLGSDGYLLGDRIAPQTINASPNPQQKGVVVVNYADRAAGEPMTTQPSQGKSVYLKLDPATMQWGIVQPNFEGESR